MYSDLYDVIEKCVEALRALKECVEKIFGRLSDYFDELRRPTKPIERLKRKIKELYLDMRRKVHRCRNNC